MWQISSKNGRVPEKIFNGIFFRNQLFRFKICFETHSESILKKKSIILVQNFHYVANFVKKGRVPEKNFQREIFFDINFFGLEYVLKHSEKKSKILVENFHHVVILVKKR